MLVTMTDDLNRRITALQRDVIALETRRNAAEPEGRIIAARVEDCAHKAVQLATARALSRLKSRFEADFR